jgi:hypothetical protein
VSEIKTIIVMGIGRGEELNASIRAALITQHGEDLIILSESEARDKCILKGNVPSISQFKITAPPVMKMPEVFFDSYSHKEECKKGWRK